MATAVEITDPKLSIYVPVPHGSTPGACRVRHGAVNIRQDGDYWPTCWSCRSIPDEGVRLVVPISLMHTAKSQLYTAARDYKNRHIHKRVRSEHSLLLAATFERFLRKHGECIEQAAAAWDAITIVPSTRGQDPHPLEGALKKSPALRGQLEPLLRSTGETVERNNPNADAFEVTSNVNHRNVLIADDTFTSGSHIQSAAIALTRGGAHVVAAVPIGRIVDTDLPEKTEFWCKHRRRTFRFDRCCLEP